MLIARSALSSMAMPVTGFNEDTKVCAEFFMGDECVGCKIPEGWKTLDFGESCPDGYSVIEARSECKPYKTTFCCTVNHSGANGDCEDVVVNHNSKQCAFADDIEECNDLPFGWERAEVNELWGSRLCPSYEYEWLEEEITCRKE